MTTFSELIESRKSWISRVLEPWCRRAGLADLKKAEAEWGDIAGRVDPEATLWTWAWSRFPELVHEGIVGVNETRRVRVTLKDGREFVGYPDNRNSRQGQLYLVPCGSADQSDYGPFSIDDIAAVATSEEPPP